MRESAAGGKIGAAVNSNTATNPGSCTRTGPREEPFEINGSGPTVAPSSDEESSADRQLMGGVEEIEEHIRVPRSSVSS